MSGDLFSLGLLAAGAYVVANALKDGGNPGTFGAQTSGAQSSRPASSTEIDTLIATGEITPEQAEQVTVVTELTPAGQTIQYAAIINPWDTSQSQVWIDPDDLTRSQGVFIPQVDRALVTAAAMANGGYTDYRDYLSRAAGTINIFVPNTIKGTAKDWDYWRLRYDPSGSKLPDTVTADTTPLTLNGYHQLLEQNGGRLVGSEMKYPAAASGTVNLSQPASYYSQFYSYPS